PGHQRVTGEDHADANDVIGKGRGLVLGHCHHRHQRQHHQTQTADPAAQKFDLRFFPAEVQLRDAARRKNPVGGVEQQPGQGDLEKRRAQIDVLASRIDLQRERAHRQGERQRHGQQNVDKNRQRRLPLPIPLEVADVSVQAVELVVQRFALPHQRANHQKQRQEDQRSLRQPVVEFADARRPRQRGQLLDQARLDAFKPLQVQRLVAGDPEHLLVEGFAQAHGRADQLLLIELQSDGFVEKRTQLSIQAFQQIAAGGGEIQQGFAQRGRDVFRFLRGQECIDIRTGAAHLLALLVDLELVQPNVSDFVSQATVELELGQRLLLFVEDFGQQQAAAQDVDLFIQRLIRLGQRIELGLGLEVLLGGCCPRLSELRGTAASRFPIALASAKVLQLAIAGKFLPAQGDQGVDRREFGIQGVALIGIDGLAAVLAGFENIVDRLSACLAAADLGLGTFGAGLRGDGQAVGVVQGLLQVSLLGAALTQHLLKFGHVQAGVALSHRNDLTGLELGQLPLVFGRLPGGVGELLFQVFKLLLVILLAGQKCQRLLQHLLQGFLVVSGQFAIGDFVQAALYGLAGQWGRIGGERRYAGEA
nr:hypothetical protein [Tanacetum cinerariifolium]